MTMPDGQSVFKIYYISIIGRDDPARYEWGQGPFTMEDFEEVLRNSGMEGIGFVTAFPHIAKVFRFAPSMETVVHVRAYNTRDWVPMNLGREDGYVEFACYAEAAIAADEYRAWACADSVVDYLRFHSSFDDGPIKNNAKISGYWKA